jgi:hypothetical protein
LRNYFLDEITKNALEIVQNPFGNYIIQHILDELGPDIAMNIINVIISTIISLSMQKFSSNVVEKCFDLVDMVILFFNFRTLEKEWLKSYLILARLVHF